jgi:hypothetical protein
MTTTGATYYRTEERSERIGILKRKIAYLKLRKDTIPQSLIDELASLTA